MNAMYVEDRDADMEMEIDGERTGSSSGSSSGSGSGSGNSSTDISPPLSPTIPSSRASLNQFRSYPLGLSRPHMNPSLIIIDDKRLTPPLTSTFFPQS